VLAGIFISIIIINDLNEKGPETLFLHVRREVNTHVVVVIAKSLPFTSSTAAAAAVAVAI